METGDRKPKIIVICGPTGIGKTTIAIRVAGAFGGEIIGADSMQIYRQMDIGTAKPTAVEQAQIRHHLIDVADPAENFDAARYARMARSCIDHLISRDVLPVIVGGTGLYIKALLHGLSPSAVADPAVTNRLKREAITDGSRRLHQRLTDCDPAAARRIHPNDTFRTVRALAVYESTGRLMSEIQQTHRFADHVFDALKIGLDMERLALYARIDRRVDKMLAAGFIDEVRGLLARGIDPRCKAMQAIGYREGVDWLAGRTSEAEMIRLMKRNSRRYAKRQLTWFKADGEITWTAPDQWEGIRKQAAAFLGRPALLSPGHEPGDEIPAE